MNCFMFPGQPLLRGSSLPADPDFSEIAELVARVARLHLESFEWLEGGSSDNVKLQLFGVAQSLYMLRRLRRQGVEPDLVAEHSMGIYPALVACGSLSEADALEITFRVGSTLADMPPGAQYALGCVIGLTDDKVLALAREAGVHLANHNTSRHFLLSGTSDAIARAANMAMARGAFSSRIFGCDAPLHSPLIAPLQRKLRAIFGDYLYGEPAVPLLNHLDQRYLRAGEIPDFMLRELSLPVFWEKSYRALRGAGVKVFFEVGPGEALRKYNRWIEGDLAAA
jgi:[acyl-carrier-protein] S-malonyltransferase